MPMMDVYNFEKDLGLTKIDELDEDGLSYEFNMLGAFLHKESGRVFWAPTSGCSCPSPYHESRFDGPDNHDIREVLPHSMKDLEEAVNAFPAKMEDKMKFLANVREEIRKQKASKVDGD